MAAADYYLCDVCGCKTFYDSDVDYGDRVGEMVVICSECAKTHKIHVLAAHSEQGWVSVSPETMPKMGDDCWAVNIADGDVEFCYSIDFEDMMEFEQGKYSHFAKIQWPSPPKSEVTNG